MADRVREMQPSNPLPVMIREESTLMRNWGKLRYQKGWNITIPIHGLEYWVVQMKLNMEIDGIISKALIDSGAMILVMSRGSCEKHGYENITIWII